MGFFTKNWTTPPPPVEDINGKFLGDNVISIGNPGGSALKRLRLGIFQFLDQMIL